MSDMGRPDESLKWMSEGFDYFAVRLGQLEDDQLAEPSALPGWTRKHVIAHLGFNARAVGRLVRWAHTGQKTPMYPSPTARAEEIAEGAQWNGKRLRRFVRDEQGALSDSLNALDDLAWTAEVVTGQGRTVPASELAWMRTREVWIHAFDLGAGGSFGDFPPAILDRLIAEAVAKHQAMGVMDLAVQATDRSGDAVGQPTRVEGTAADLARWLTRRDPDGVRTADGSILPGLQPWL
ncbi:maleylpyruvate isomerase family mycothiol-dependent enzyme [Streptomyces sp. NBC_01361]|uniref:maleylpyruvate isomerase family mycothiol-dependent enzyme n=1 Tax=Streptomyces sp. NBC_01361 TaxID=2903838 RepID=UPI002E3241F8|nr:maleylpyruvate isomerase family mycothiol-dependent enzyme [Streptomyces sp. NBC_01361]